MVGDQQDMSERLRAVLPTRWFGDNTPVLDSLLAGLAWAWSWAYGLLQYVRAQTRLASATDSWLDIIAQDFFGLRITRRPAETDDSFRARVRRELLRDRGTRAAVSAAIQDLTGREPRIFEPANPSDAGGYGSLVGAGGGLGYGAAGGWGNLNLPFQCFVTAYRPLGQGISSVSGWGGNGGGYGKGAIEYANVDMVAGQVTDSDIYTAIAETIPLACVAWTQISS